MKTTYIPPLQKEWEERKKLWEEGIELRIKGMELWKDGNKLCDEGIELRIKGMELLDQGRKFRIEGNKLCDEGNKLCDEGNKLWKEAVERYYGKDVKVTWREWHKDNEPTCHIGSDVYV